MELLCSERVCIVTGAGRGIGREHALSLARHGAKVVVNDLGGAVDGAGAAGAPAQAVVDEITRFGGEAIASSADVASFDGAAGLVGAAIERFGRLDVLVNNAGILRDRMLVNMSEAEWDDVIRVHLKGTFAPTRHAADHWRQLSKSGATPEARVINTTSVSGIYGNIGQCNYGAAKMGVAAFTLIASMELARYGVTVNAVAPAALTRMTENLGMGRVGPAEAERLHPRWVAPVVTWLASTESAEVTGRVFEASGRVLAVAEGWHRGPTTAPTDDPTRIGPLIEGLLAQARRPADMNGSDRPVL